MYCLLFKVISLFVAFVFLQNVCRNVSNKNYLSIQGSKFYNNGFLLSFTESFDRQIKRINNSMGNRKIISVYKSVCLVSMISNSQNVNGDNEHLPSKSYEQPNRNSTNLVMLVNKSNLLPELFVCSIKDRGQFPKDFGNITSLHQQEEESLSQAPDLLMELLLYEEANAVKKNSHEQIAHEDIAMEPKMLLNTSSEEGITSHVDKFTDGRKKIQGTSLDFKLTSSSHAAMFYKSFAFVDKILTSIKRKSVPQQQFKTSLNPELTNLESFGKMFTSNTIFEKDRNDSEEFRTSNSIVYHLVVVFLENLPDGIYKNLDSEYHRIVDEYNRRQGKDDQKPRWKQLANNVLRSIKLFTRLTNSLIFQMVMYIMSHFTACIGILMQTIASWFILLIHWILHIAAFIINVIGISPRDLFYLGLFLVIIVEVKKHYEKQMEMITQRSDVQLHVIQNHLKSKLNEQQAALELLKKQHDRERVRSGNILMEQSKKLKKLAEKVGKQKADKRIPLPFPTIPIPPPSFASSDFNQRLNVAGPPPSFPNMFPLGINLHSNAAQYRPAPPPMQRRFTVGAPSAAFSVPSKPGVAPALFTPRSSSNHSHYPQHSHPHNFTKEVNPLQYIGCPDNYVPPSSLRKRNV